MNKSDNDNNNNSNNNNNNNNKNNSINNSLLRYFNFESSFKPRWCCARDIFRSHIPVTTGGFEL